MSMDEVEHKHIMPLFCSSGYGKSGFKYIHLLFDRFLLVLRDMDKVDLLFDRFLLILQSIYKVDPSTSTCCLTVSYLFFRADEYGGGGPQISHSSV